ATSGIDTRSRRQRAEQISVVTERSLQRTRSFQRRWQRFRRRHRAQRLVDAGHQSRRGEDLLPRAVLESSLENVARRFGFLFLVLDAAAEQEQEVGANRALFRGNRYRRFVDR